MAQWKENKIENWRFYLLLLSIVIMVLLVDEAVANLSMKNKVRYLIGCIKKLAVLYVPYVSLIKNRNKADGIF